MTLEKDSQSRHEQRITAWDGQAAVVLCLIAFRLRVDCTRGDGALSEDCLCAPAINNIFFLALSAFVELVACDCMPTSHNFVVSSVLERSPRSSKLP